MVALVVLAFLLLGQCEDRGPDSRGVACHWDDERGRVVCYG
jgi:hypothetical protein